uniref:Mitogen-activated protein kinase kinase 4 n=1 Tax=Mus musculus TaxID=10090 RepID=M0QWR0_MOUSE
MAAPSPSGGGGSGGGGGTPGPIGPPASGHPAVSSMQGKRKALKLNFANPPVKSTARFTLNPNTTGVQNPHIEFGQLWMKKNKNNFSWIWM